MLKTGVVPFVCAAVASGSVAGVGRVGRRPPSDTASPVVSRPMVPFVARCQSALLCSDISAEAADHGSASRGVGVAFPDMAVVYTGGIWVW